jgi:DNA-binding HxlR family transcriptional regulator
MTYDALEWSVDNCTIGRTMDILGERWNMVVLREIFNGIRRFDEMRIRTGIPRQVLSDRLAALVERGILRRVAYREPGARERFEYRPTVMGFDLYPVMVAVKDWGDRYLADPAGSALRLEHRDCGAELHAAIVCDDGHVVDDNRSVKPRPGPGARRRVS